MANKVLIPSVDDMKHYQRLVPLKVHEAYNREQWFFMHQATGETISYVSVYRYDDPHVNHVLLCDIEVREEYRGMRYAREALATLAWEHKKNISHEDGGYTLDGAERIAHFFHTATDGVSAEFSPMTFVDDWEFMFAR